MEKLKDAGMEDLHIIEEKDSDWKWKNGDLAVKHWFENFGKELDFDMLHIVEWDLLLASPLSDLYSNVGPGQIGLTGLKPIGEAKEHGWSWVNDEYAAEWKKLKDFVYKELNCSESSYSCIFPAACLPREFLEKFAAIEVPELCNDEVRVPLIAEALGFEMKDTGFFGTWGDEEVYQYFNAKGQEIEKEKIKEQISDSKGRRAFHPVREVIGIDKIERWKDNY